MVVSDKGEMSDEELAVKWVTTNTGFSPKEPLGKIAVRTYLAGLKAGRPQWHKIFKEEPHWDLWLDLPKDSLPKVDNFYFVRLKNGYIKVCEFKSEFWDGRKYFYDLHGCKQTNVVEWLEYPMIQGE